MLPRLRAILRDDPLPAREDAAWWSHPLTQLPNLIAALEHAEEHGCALVFA